jgi:hypothetical protein
MFKQFHLNLKSKMGFVYQEQCKRSPFCFGGYSLFLA